ncbi:MAG TPA: hypothetical protein VI643_05235 [Planctomycetota bacterium]|nr:hypothetical protein [Planctomycetota bacterium]
MDWEFLGPGLGLAVAWFGLLAFGARLIVAHAVGLVGFAMLVVRVFHDSAGGGDLEVLTDVACAGGWGIILGTVMGWLASGVIRARIGRPAMYQGDVTAEFSEAVLEADDALIHLDFRAIGYLLQEGKGVEEIEPVLLSADGLTAARIVPWKVGSRAGCHVQFGSHRGTRRAATGNWTSPPLTPLSPGVSVRHAFNMEDLAELYRAHARHCVEFLGGAPEAMQEGEVIPRMVDSLRAHMELLRADGLMRTDPSGAVYRFTPRGIRRFLWGLLCMPRGRGAILGARGTELSKSSVPP